MPGEPHDQRRARDELIYREGGANASDLAELSDDLAELTALVVATQSAMERIETLGRELRTRGATWQQLADAAGITPQAAYQRWSEHGKRRHRDVQRRRASELRRAAATSRGDGDDGEG